MSSPVTCTKVFKKEFGFSERRAESQRIRQRHPDRIPVICEKAANCKGADIKKKKFLVPFDMTTGQFNYAIRKLLHLAPEQGIFLFIDGGVVPPTSSLVAHMFEEHMDADGFLYITYDVEGIFGG